MEAPAQYSELKKRLSEIYDLYGASSVLGWDQATYMPPGGAAARARQLGTLSKLAQEKLTDPAIGKLLDELRSFENNLSRDSDEASLIRVTRRSYQIATLIPPALVEEISNHIAMAYQTWAKARPENNFVAVQDNLEKTLDYSRQYAESLRPLDSNYRHVMDPLIDLSDYGMQVETVQSVFTELRQALVPLVKAISESSVTDDACLYQSFPGDQQLAFAKEVIQKFGYDFQRGRQDPTHHPFATRFSAGDVRITTRVDDHHLGDGIFATFHESGHGMYEQGINVDFDATPLGGGTSAGIHESQSRTWENIVGRSRAFWEHYYAPLQALFPDQLKNVSLDTFYRAINKVEPSLVRVKADEVTYNLHIMVRFDFELALLEGKLAVKDLPEAWNARYQADLGITPSDYKDGVMQDVHWFAGLIGGAFQGYTLGNILGAQFYQTALKSHPEIPAEIGQGKFDTLYGWLRANIYQHGSKYNAPELIQRVTGGPLDVQPLVSYLYSKYGEIYGLNL
ncbi:MAG: carboxypeptidase M32 [Chloroflexi bacterium]|nr:carboxypeptidase M32 [Chloroflexota bacterium]